MIDNPVTCPIDYTINEALLLMGSEKVNTLMVTEVGTDKLLGVLRKEHVQSARDKNLSIRDILISGYIFASPDDSIVDILKEVDKYGINNIPVVDKSKLLEGLITKSSLVETLSQQYINKQGEVY